MKAIVSTLRRTVSELRDTVRELVDLLRKPTARGHSDYGKIDNKCTGKELVKLEEEAVGLGHPEAGYMVADRWELPEEIATLIRFHHTPELAENMQTEASIVSVAAFLSEAHSNQADLKSGEAFKEVQSVIESLGLSTEQLVDIYSETASNLAA